MKRGVIAFLIGLVLAHKASKPIVHIAWALVAVAAFALGHRLT